MLGINTTNLACFANQLNSKKNYIKITESADIVRQYIKCGVPQGSIPGPFIFQI